ncbi:hypothetical protein ACJX0J_022442, partial [Zea mays]
SGHFALIVHEILVELPGWDAILYTGQMLVDEAMVLRKNDLDKREDRPKPVCYISTRDLVQEHIAFRGWLSLLKIYISIQKSVLRRKKEAALTVGVTGTPQKGKRMDNLQSASKAYSITDAARGKEQEKIKAYNKFDEVSKHFEKNSLPVEETFMLVFASDIKYPSIEAVELGGKQMADEAVRDNEGKGTLFFILRWHFPRNC